VTEEDTHHPLVAVIRHAREQHEDSQTKLAARLGFRAKTINDWENGRRDVSGATLGLVAEAYETTPAELLKAWVDGRKPRRIAAREKKSS
jgi:transcriptional regulator with XRE-family HTH domain